MTPKDLFVEIIANTQQDALRFHSGSVFKVVCRGLSRAGGGRIYRLFKTEADWDAYQLQKRAPLVDGGL